MPAEVKSSAASCGGFHPHDSRQMSMQAWPLGSLPTGIKVRGAGTESFRRRGAAVETGERDGKGAVRFRVFL